MRTLVLFSALAVVLSSAPALVSQPVAVSSTPQPDDLAEPPEPAQAPEALPDAPLPAQSAPNSAPAPTPNPLKRFLDTTAPLPLTPEQKAHLAIKGLTSWGNLITITGTAAYTIGTDAHTAYGPGLKGFGRNTGYSLLQDTTGTFFGTFLIPSLAHEDPRYRRMPHAKIGRRFLHAISWTIIAHSDYGKTMPNYANLLTNPICAEISNLYVPGVNGNGPSTVERILAGYETDPVDSLITEFLPDVASHIHVHDIFVQRILNKIATGQYIP
jgi:hypothetical protein